MVDVWDEYKEMVFMAPFFIILFVGQRELGDAYPYLFWGSLVFLGVGMFGFPWAVELQAGEFSPLILEVYGPRRYTSNNRVQFLRDGRPVVQKLAPGQYRVIQQLRQPYPRHPKFREIRRLIYYCGYHPFFLWSLSEQVTMYWRGSNIKNRHGDSGILYEREPITHDFRTEPQFDLIHATNTWAIKTGKLKVFDIKEAEEMAAR